MAGRFILLWLFQAGLARAETTITPLSVPGGGPGFSLMTSAQTGVAFTNSLSDARAGVNQIRLNGSGVALGDVDGDGRCDIFLANLDGDNALFLNRGGWQFRRGTNSPAIACAGEDSSGVALADVDGDGDLDLLVTGVGVGARLFVNDGHGQFTERADSGLFRKGGGTTMALADVDGDGDLDLYACNYRSQTARSTGLMLLNVNGRREVPPDQRRLLEITPEGRVLEHGEPDVLYLNDGTGRFAPVSWTSGAFLYENGEPLKQTPYEWALTAQFRDLNADGRPDLYVCNDFHSPDRLWFNESTNGIARFRLAPPLTLRHTPTFSMVIDFADFNRDGRDDFFEADMLGRSHARRLVQLAATDPFEGTPGVFQDRPQYGRNVLQLARGDGTFADVAWQADVAATDWTWSAIALDVDLDGYEDLLCATGHAFDTQDLDADARIQAAGPWTRERMAEKLLMYPRSSQRNLAFHNETPRGPTNDWIVPRFRDASAEWGFDLNGVSQGMALADLDGDGDLDVVINNLNGSASLYRNNAPAPRVSVRLRGAGANTRGIGARVTVHGGPVPQAQEIIAGGRYLSCDQAERTFAAGSAPTLALEVRWPSGRVSSLTSVPANSRVEVVEDAAAPVALPQPESRPAPLFEDVSARLNHQSAPVVFDELTRQPLLPQRLAGLGPGVAWLDSDADGRDELAIAGKGIDVFRWTNGRFDPVKHISTAREVTMVLPLADKFAFGESSYVDGATNTVVVRTQDGLPLVPPLTECVGPLAAADVDGDGDLDLFVGGRVIPGRWPEPAASRWFRNDSGRWVEAQSWPKLGLVSAAVFTDLDRDGDPDLVVACDWGAVKIAINQRGNLQPWLSLPDMRPDGAPPRETWTGRWTSVAAADFDEDGFFDLLVGNWGENAPYAREQPSVYYGELAGRDTVEVLDAVYDPDVMATVPTRPLNALEAGWPALRELFPTHAAFNRTTVLQILDACGKPAVELQLRSGATTLFLNRGQRFEPRRLPDVVQASPVLGAGLADFDGDGHEDVFLAQNFFGVDGHDARLDAGRGVVLLGDGRGGFRALNSIESGIVLDGEGRGVAVADFDADGRPDLAATQHGAATRVWRNVAGKPGVRVTLHGAAQNPRGIGALVRLRTSTGTGAWREIHAGGGYWSCDSPSVVVACLGDDRVVEIRWPDGRKSEATVEAGASAVSMSPPP